MFRLSDLKRELKKLGEPERPRPERRTATGLAARYGLDPTFTPAEIKDISSSGIYLCTEKRLPTGELITLILQELGEPQNSSGLQISVQARVARQGEDGVGLSFVLPPGMNADLWAFLMRNIVTLKDRNQVAELFRTLRTVFFLCRLCQSEAEQAILLLIGELPADRAATLVKITLGAENLLAAEPDAGCMRAHPQLVANILSEGSWVPDEATVQLWTGLLASSCSVEAPDDSNQILVDLLEHLTPVQAKIFVHACQRALASAAGPENSDSGPIVLSPQEMIDLTGVHDHYRNATDLAYLFNLGLVQKVFDFTSYHDVESFDITPTSLGLGLYVRCHGHREKLEPHLVEVAVAHLANFLSSPTSTDHEPKTGNSPSGATS